nr:LysR family transcriptional regulator [Roseateles koreensis]
MRVFEAAASTRSFTRAAELLDLSQAAVSQQIRQLEQEVSAKLFDTAVRPVRITEAGYELLRHARTILAQLSIAMEALCSLDGQYQGRLCIGVVRPANYFVAQLMEAFRLRYPNVRMKLVIDKRDPLLAMLADHRIDIAIGGYPPVQAEVDAEAFARNPHFLVAPSSHRLAGQRGLNWADLSGEPFVLREQGSATRHFLEHMLQTQGLQVRTDFELEGNEAVKHAVMLGLGLSFLSGHVIQTELEAGKLVTLDVAGMPKCLDWCVWRRREAYTSALPDAFRAFLLEEGARHCACPLGTPAPQLPWMAVHSDPRMI